MSRTGDHPTIRSMGARLGPSVERQFETICRTLLGGPGSTLEPGFCRIVTGAPHPLGNFAVISDPADAEQSREAIEPLLGLRAPSAAIFPGRPTDPVHECLTGSGYAVAETMPAMAVDLEELRYPETPEGYEFLIIDPLSQRDVWNEALAAGYEIPRVVADLFLPETDLSKSFDGALRYFAVSDGTRLVGTSTLFLEGGLAGIYCVSTHPEHRGKGIGAYATAEPLRWARERGYRIGVLQSSAMGEPVYRRLGFEDYGTLPLYVRMPD